jgi:hypothetical protein
MKMRSTIPLVVEIVLVSILGCNLYFMGAWSVWGVGISLVLAWLAWMGMSTARLRLLKWFSLIAVVLTVTGLCGMSLAIHAYPESNLLGGWGLILGPIYWLGLLISVFAVLAWIVVGLSWLWRKKVKHAA